MPCLQPRPTKPETLVKRPPGIEVFKVPQVIPVCGQVWELLV